MKVSLLINLVLFTVFCPCFATINYAGDVDKCTVERVGTYPDVYNAELNRSGYPIFLSHASAWTGTRCFFLAASLGKEGLATALAALSIDKTVFVRIGSSTAPNSANSIITIIYMNKE